MTPKLTISLMAAFVTMRDPLVSVHKIFVRNVSTRGWEYS